jgi:RND family efflux transporter MFP subunit
MTVGQPFAVTGVVQSRSDVLLSATVEGELSWVAQAGVLVSANNLLARVDDRALLLRKAELELLASRSGIDMNYLQGEVERLTALHASNLASETTLAEMVSRRDLAENEQEIANARVSQINEELGRTRILAPVDGVIAERFKQTGEFARRGEPLVRLVDIQSLEVRISVPLTYLHRVREEAILEVEVGALKFEGRVRTVVRTGEERSQTFEVLIDVPTAVAGLILDGQFAAVSVPVHQRDLSLVVPRDAVVLRSEGTFVFRIDEQNNAKRVPVILGEGQGNLVTVDGNLSVGDKVAIRGVERLEDGQKVQPTS